ncbi:DUF3299 domain-containing protein [Ruegeria sediminis]|uniref:DUF3299 domain-containing protein n=2 Tax=Ruegeria sediminis TaxID=2583820 RepID=A0ABY2X622_9RHOB|nr:DUF3299 domain-containing protein [Ruegeria sediminis]
MSRRAFLRQTILSGCVLTAAGLPLKAEEAPIELRWSDLAPDAGGEAMEALRRQGVIQHGQLSTPFDQETNAQVTTEYNGKRVRIPGYLVPLEYKEQGVTSALLVPYVGACIHVPPPPPNQLIFVTTEKPYESRSLFEPVHVTGMFGTAATNTQLAEVGYALSADEIVPYS